MPTLDQNQRITRPFLIPNKPPRFQIRGEVHRGAAPGSGSNAPGGAARSPARKARQASKSRRARSAMLALRRTRANAASVDHSPPQAMPISCWQRTSSGPGIGSERLDPPGPGALGGDDPAGQLGGGGGEEHPPGLDPDGVARPADPLEAARHAAGQADQDGQVGLADVDAQLQAGAGDDRLQLARLERRLDRAAPLGVERRVVCGDGLAAVAQVEPEVVGDLLGERPGVGEDDGRPGLGVAVRAGGSGGGRSGRGAGPRRASAATRPRARAAGVPAGRGASITRQSRPGPTRNRATGSGGRQVAESPTRPGSPSPWPPGVRARPSGRPLASGGPGRGPRRR